MNTKHSRNVRLQISSYLGVVLLVFFLCMMSISVKAQRIGIGLSNPMRKLSVNGSVMIDQNNTNPGTLDSAALIFGGNGSAGIAGKKTAGGNQEGLSFFTNGIAQMHISQGGNVSIGGLQNFNRFTVHNGNSYFDGNFQAAGLIGVGGSVDLSYRLRIYGDSRFGGDMHATGNVGFYGAHDPLYALRVWGLGTTRFDGTVHMINNLSIGGAPDNNYRLRVYDGNTRFGGDVHATGNAAIGGAVDNSFRLRVYDGNTRLGGDAEITGDITIGGNGAVRSNGSSPLNIGFVSKEINVFMPAKFSFVPSVAATGFPTNYSDMRLMTAQIETYDDNQVPVAAIKIITRSYNGGTNAYNFVLENGSNVAGTLHVKIYFAIIGREWQCLELDDNFFDTSNSIS
jgi:hypothetical protein